ncbi:hypothetical protein GQ55_1G075600 [Panicum hallii var. hallii]|uniref:Uncharacterized protein n=1 Tax=Panicum hallii var. hallii TaxID=1504633 RepID=A0A2T7F3D1_9POAL|nr:hypothetical protein GQ55_1G075600 [Panicum hallii var. hallii]
MEEGPHEDAINRRQSVHPRRHDLRMPSRSRVMFSLKPAMLPSHAASSSRSAGAAATIRATPQQEARVGGHDK